MAASTAALSFDEYLKTSFPDLDCEFVDGEIRERAMPDPIHARIQVILASLFQAKFQISPVDTLILNCGFCLGLD